MLAIGYVNHTDEPASGEEARALDAAAHVKLDDGLMLADEMFETEILRIVRAVLATTHVVQYDG